MSDWKIVVPETVNNRVLNPSGETTLNFTAVGGGCVRATTYAKYGLYSYHVTTAANHQGMTLTLAQLTHDAHYITMAVRGILPAAWHWSLDNAAWAAPAVVEVLDANWTVYGLAVAEPDCHLSTLLYIYQDGNGAGDFYVDGVQVEAKSYWTTYCDGDQSGCSWDNAKHASTSTRSAQSRAGGRVRDMATTYGLYIGELSGEGMGPISNILDTYSIIPGGEMQGYKVQSRPFTIVGTLIGTSMSNLHTLRQALLNVLKPDAAPDHQPVVLRYEGATVHKQISAYYEGGLEYAVSAQTCSVENLALRFLAADPYWYEIGQSAAVLDDNDALTTRYVAARLMSTGQWSALGLAADPTAGGPVYAVLIASDKSVYIGGNFTGWGGVAGRDYIARYIPGTGWTTVGVASDFNGIVYALAEGPTGLVYAAGAFTACHGDGQADYLAVWNGTIWDNVGDPDTGTAAITSVRCLAFDHSGNLYVGGVFANWADEALADCLAHWDGTNWTAVGTFAGYATLVGIYAIAIAPDMYTGIDFIAIGGNFTNLAGNALSDYAAYCRGYGAVWLPVVKTIALNGIVYCMAHRPDGRFFFGGAFTDAEGIAGADYIVEDRGYEGEVFLALGTGVNDIVYSLHIAEDGLIWVGGDFTEAGTLTGVTYLAIWNGSSWELPDLVLNASAVFAIDTGAADSVVAQNYDVWVGFDTSAASAIAGTATVTNDGTENAYPVFYVYRTGGGTQSRLVSIRNETTGKKLNFNYLLLAGETLTIDLTPARKRVTSSFWGGRAAAILASSDLGTFCLQPGANQITFCVDIVGADVVAAWSLFSDPYWSLD